MGHLFVSFTAGRWFRYAADGYSTSGGRAGFDTPQTATQPAAAGLVSIRRRRLLNQRRQEIFGAVAEWQTHRS
jgi:hypothetical protein